jgi:5-methyltetrahydropteroyltriglutamate--homocysteine methyltransferase
MTATPPAADALTDPPRADVIGSLLRPRALLEARTEWHSGRLSSADYKRVEDGAVNEAIALQERCGLDVVTDGEMRRMFFTGVVTEALDGIELIAGQTTTWHGTGSADETIQLPVAVTGTLRRRRSLATEEYSYARARTTKPVKVTLPSPLMLSYFWSPEHSTVAYADPFEMFADAAEIIAGEARELAGLGCRYIQIDAPELITLADPTQVAYFDALGISGDRMLDEGIEIINACADVPGVRFVMHLCRGNNRGKWLAEGGYGAISRKVFSRADNFDGFALEYDSPRAGTFEPLHDVPNDRTVILGLVSTKSARIEPREEIVARIDEAGRYFPREQLALSTQCGFASEQSGNPVTPEVQAEKLALVAEIAHGVL